MVEQPSNRASARARDVVLAEGSRRIESETLLVSGLASAVGSGAFGQVGFMGQAREPEKDQGPSSLATAVLAAVVAAPSHGWDIAKWLNARMAPMWQFDRRRVYEVLSSLEADGLLWSEVVRDGTAPGGYKRVFHATLRGVETCSVWLQEGEFGLELMRGDIHAWLLLSRPEEAPALLAKLAELEQDCMGKAEAIKEPAGSSVGWGERMFSQQRAGIREQYRCELRSISRARQEIEEYLAERT
jgi:DNA-binding PadR family transcriptional regulator